MDQHQRTATLDAFRNGTIAFLAASDVAARGLDIPDVSHIFNYDVPIHPEDYIHRIGRTGRAGREGFAAMLVTPKDIKALKAIERMLKTRDRVDGRHAGMACRQRRRVRRAPLRRQRTPARRGAAKAAMAALADRTIRRAGRKRAGPARTAMETRNAQRQW